jgi:hypothetical protein
MKLRSKRTLVLLGIIAVVAFAAVGAYAYFTSGGSGSGTASVGTSTAFVLHGSAPTTLYPGTSSNVTFTVDNPGSGHQQLGTIYLASVDAYPTALDRTNQTNVISGCGSVDPGNAANPGTSDFYMADVPVNADYAPGSGQAVTPTGTLKMNDTAVSQDACKNAFLQLNLSTR